MRDRGERAGCCSNSILFFFLARREESALIFWNFTWAAEALGATHASAWGFRTSATTWAFVVILPSTSMASGSLWERLDLPLRQGPQDDRFLQGGRALDLCGAEAGGRQERHEEQGGRNGRTGCRRACAWMSSSRRPRRRGLILQTTDSRGGGHEEAAEADLGPARAYFFGVCGRRQVDEQYPGRLDGQDGGRLRGPVGFGNAELGEQRLVEGLLGSGLEIELRRVIRAVLACVLAGEAAPDPRARVNSLRP